MNKNQILLKKGLIHFENGGQDNLSMAMSCQAELMKYGYMLDKPAFQLIQSLDSSDIKDFHKDVITYLKEMTGDTRTYKPLFGNFPSDVMSLSNSEMAYLQLLHYWTNSTFNVETQILEITFEEIDYKIITTASDEDVINIYVRTSGSGQSLTPVDIQILKWFATQTEFELPVVDVPFKENLSVLVNLIPGLKVKTVTDVLRVAEVMSGGDGTLPPMPRTKHKRSKLIKYQLSDMNKDRILNMFENSNLDLREMNTGSKYGRFIRLSEIIKPGKNKSKYPKTFNAFNVLRNQKRKGKSVGHDKIRTWYYDLNTAFKVDLITGLKKLSERPGEFIRKVDWLVRKYNRPKQIELILQYLTNCAPSNKTLFEVYTHFSERNDKVSNRSVFIKGARKPVELPKLQAIPDNLIDSIKDTILNSIKNKFSELPLMGRVYIDTDLKKIPLPTNMRSLSESLIPVIRGQRTPLNIDTPIIRAFVHWYNDGKRKQGCDIDLSAVLLTENGKVLHVGWNGDKRNSHAIYSGDVTNQTGACAEYIDIDVKKSLQSGYRYVLLDARDYRTGGFSTYKECVTGFMGLQTQVGGSTWRPDTIKNCIKITTSGDGVLLCIIDLSTLEYIWLDIDSTKNMVSNDLKNVSTLVKKYSKPPELSVYDLIEWHVDARKGLKVPPEDADEMYLYDDYSKDYTKILPLMGV